MTRLAFPALLALALLVPAAAQDGVEFLETPYTAEQLKKACTAERTLTYKQTADGKSRTLTLRFEKPDDKGCLLVATATPEPGEGEKEEEKDQATWEDLRDHAKFEKSKATRSEGKVTVPAGTMDCFIYTVREDTIVTTLWFSKENAGPPVKEEVKEGEKVIYLMELQKDEKKAAEKPAGPSTEKPATDTPTPSTEKR